jgi:hypothetical protein
MKSRFTYKEATLIIGILVAAIVVLTLWMTSFQTTGHAQGTSLIPQLSSIQDHPIELVKNLTASVKILY